METYLEKGEFFTKNQPYFYLQTLFHSLKVSNWPEIILFTEP